MILRREEQGTTLLLWTVSESEEELRVLVNEEDRTSASRFSLPRRRIEHLAWRAALRVALPDTKVGYTEAGAPVLMSDGLHILMSDELHISVAHTAGLVAVLLSKRPCAVDVECETRDFGAVHTRFISAAESELPDAVHPDFPAAVWCAKETMYKLARSAGLDFLRDLAIASSDLSRGKIYGCIADGASIEMNVLSVEGYFVIYTHGNS